MTSTKETIVSSNDGREPTAVETLGMEWWNSLADEKRAHWMATAGNTGIAADAWSAMKATGMQPAFELALEVKKWWNEHHGDTTGPYGERNVYECEPDFVTKAKEILGDWPIYSTGPTT